MCRYAWSDFYVNFVMKFCKLYAFKIVVSCRNFYKNFELNGLPTLFDVENLENSFALKGI